MYFKRVGRVRDNLIKLVLQGYAGVHKAHKDCLVDESFKRAHRRWNSFKGLIHQTVFIEVGLKQLRVLVQVPRRCEDAAMMPLCNSDGGFL